MNRSVSVVIPNYNGGKTLARCLKTLRNQTCSGFEVILVDDCSVDNSLSIAGRYADRILSTRKNSGPAAARNLGIKKSRGELILFIDADCVPGRDWVEKMAAQFDDDKAQVVMGKVEIEKSDFIGDSISALGYPAGGSIGFERMWRVSPEGYTHTFSSCNCGFRREIFDRFGTFDEDFPCAGGEDTLLAKKIFEGGGRIRYCPDAVVVHAARSGIRSFIAWQINRGMSIYLFRKKAGSIKGNVRNRFWSMKNIIRLHLRDPRIFMVLPLLVGGLVSQQIGYLRARQNDRPK
jgi:N-acetylglucosaminyl-diphospho-decaprenol L-rhamnosyltransferase